MAFHNRFGDIAKMAKGDKILLKDASVMERWSMLILNKDQARENIFQKTEQLVKETGVEGFEIRKILASPVKEGILGGKTAMMANEREFLMIRHEGFKDFRMLVGVREYGKYLDVHWFLTCIPQAFKRMASSLLTKQSKGGSSEEALSLNLTVFRYQDLCAFTSLVHDAFTQALSAVMQETGENTAKLKERKSKGFLSIV